MSFHDFVTPMLAARRQVLTRLAMFGLLIAVMAAGCTKVQFISSYDEQTDKSLHAIQGQIETVLTSLERTLGTDEGKYDNYQSKYDSIRVALRTLQVRASSRPKNQIQKTQLSNVMDQMDLFEKAHKQGMSAEEIPSFRRGFNQSFRAMINLELAKKRGEADE